MFSNTFVATGVVIVFSSSFSVISIQWATTFALGVPSMVGEGVALMVGEGLSVQRVGCGRSNILND